MDIRQSKQSKALKQAWNLYRNHHAATWKRAVIMAWAYVKSEERRNIEIAKAQLVTAGYKEYYAIQDKIEKRELEEHKKLITVYTN